MNRRSLIKQASLATAGLMILPSKTTSRTLLQRSESTVNENMPFVANELNSLSPIDNGKALINPGMGWTMHFYSCSITNYGSKLEPSDTLDEFPGVSVVYLRLPWFCIQLRACRPGTYDLYVSVGKKDGTPLYELPYGDSDGKKRYKMGKWWLKKGG